MNRTSLYHSICSEYYMYCGLRIEVSGDKAVHVRGDPGDPVYRGGVCIKRKRALGTRFQPHEDVMILQGMPGVILDPSLPREEKETLASRTSKIVIDATKPLHVQFAEECKPKRDVAEKVEANWKKYGIS